MKVVRNFASHVLLVKECQKVEKIFFPPPWDLKHTGMTHLGRGAVFQMRGGITFKEHWHLQKPYFVRAHTHQCGEPMNCYKRYLRVWMSLKFLEWIVVRGRYILTWVCEALSWWKWDTGTQVLCPWGYSMHFWGSVKSPLKTFPRTQFEPYFRGSFPPENVTPLDGKVWCWTNCVLGGLLN